MGQYDTQVICLNGHQITDRASRVQRTTAYCDKCGAEGISKCPNCNNAIRGYYHSNGVVYLTGRTAPIPKNCEHCGLAFPWREFIEEREKTERIGMPAERLSRLLGRFHTVVRQLRARYDGRETISVKDEYDVQDLLHALLKIEFDDVRPEEWTPSYAGKSARMDFLLKNEQIVVETKMTRQGLSDKKIGDQLIVDVARYREHPDCNTLVCFVYDPEGYIRNAPGLKTDLESRQHDPVVLVHIVP